MFLLSKGAYRHAFWNNLTKETVRQPKWVHWQVEWSVKHQQTLKMGFNKKKRWINHHISLTLWESTDQFAPLDNTHNNYNNNNNNNNNYHILYTIYYILYTIYYTLYLLYFWLFTLYYTHHFRPKYTPIWAIFEKIWT